MKTVITIAHRHYLLPASANINVLLKSLGGAIELDEKYHEGEYYYFPRAQSLNIEVKAIKDSALVDGKRKLIPRHCGPHSEGQA